MDPSVTPGMPRNILIYSILGWHRPLSFRLLTRSTNPLPFNHKWAALSELHQRKSHICNDIGVYTCSPSQAEDTLGPAMRPGHIRWFPTSASTDRPSRTISHEDRVRSADAEDEGVNMAHQGLPADTLLAIWNSL